MPAEAKTETRATSDPMTGWNDPGLYRRMAEPFADTEATNAAVQGFISDLRAIREKHKMTDVLVVLQGHYATPADGESTFILVSHHGDEMKAEGMAAYAFGKMQAERQTKVSEMMDAAAKPIRRARSGK